MIKAFIFDLDGVITDTAELHYLAWDRLCTEEKIPFSREVNEQLRGLSREDSLTIILNGKQVPPEQFAAWAARKNDYYREMLLKMTPADVLPNVGEFLSAAKAHGIRLGLGSASKNAREVIGRLGLLGMFDALGDGFSVVHGKPAPDLFVWVAGRLNVPPTQAVVFEDAKAGIEGALAGGFFTVGIGSETNVGAAHLLAPHGLADLTVEAVLARFTAPAGG